VLMSKHVAGVMPGFSKTVVLMDILIMCFVITLLCLFFIQNLRIYLCSGKGQ
jgi:low affinity Fe/Cu permease